MVVTNGPIWDALREHSADKFEMIKGLADHAASLLLLVRETFPTYTLHDSEHAQNVLKLMGELLANQCDKLRGLEAAMLILAAYYHDIGMVYDADELRNIPGSEEFKKYLDSHPVAYLATRLDDAEVPNDVLLNFCRARHADHLYTHLNKVGDRLRWGNIPLIKTLADLCRSHGQPVSHLRSDEFDTDFLGACDLRFCAVILRLADILDLDSSRSPRAIYQHMRLAEHASHQIGISDAEWRKHLRSDGFIFPDERQPNYLIKFASGPDEPSVEHDIRNFLDLIDRELSSCRAILGFCSKRWMDVFLPAGVDRRSIISDGYKYGDFKFTLERSEILELFMGEHLYQNPYVFVRELVQNSIDATRLRMALHPSENVDPTVRISSWRDPEGYVWVRIDDSGIGMDETIIRDYFLRVGRSYYRSAEVEADLMRAGHRQGEGFVAISKFGVGILSCFTVADKIEVSTRRLMRDGSLVGPLTLTVSNVEDFFVLREQPMQPASTHSRSGEEHQYRAEPGTSIALRIDPTRIDITPEIIGTQVRNFVMCSPVSVTFNGQRAERLPYEILTQTLCSGPVVLSNSGEFSGKHEPDFLPSEVDQFSEPIYLAYDGPVRLVALPLDISGHTVSPLLQGQLIGLTVDLPDLSRKENDGTRGPENDLLRGWSDDRKRHLPAEVTRKLQKIVSKVEFSISAHVTGDEEEVIFDVNINQILDQQIFNLVRPQVDRILKKSNLETTTQAYDDLKSISLALNGVRETNYDDLRLRSNFLVPLASVADINFHRSLDLVNTFWCHNGIAIPGYKNEYASTDIPLGMVTLSSVRQRTDSLIFGILSFADELRPDVSVARDRIIGIPFNLHSALQLSVRRAAAAYSDGEFAAQANILGSLNLIACPPSIRPNLQNIIDDPFVSNQGWIEECVIPRSVRHASPELDDEEEYLSLAEVRGEVSKSSVGPELALYARQMWAWPRRPGNYSMFNGFYPCLAIILAQLFLNVVARFEDVEQGESIRRLEKIIVNSDEPPDIPAGLKFFPPLFFVPYHDDELTFLDGASWSFNATHKFSKWLIGNAEILSIEAPAVMARLSDIRQNRADSQEHADAVNRLIDDLRVKFNDRYFPDDIYISCDQETARLRSDA